MAKRLYKIAYGKPARGKYGRGKCDGFITVSAKNRKSAEQQARRKTGKGICR